MSLRRTPLIAKPPADHRGEPGYAAWHERTYGLCAVCGQRGLRLRHHIVTENHVRREGGDPWDLRNAIWIGVYCVERCHRRHHDGFRRIGRDLIPPAAIAFAEELLGPEAADAYMHRFYSG